MHSRQEVQTALVRLQAKLAAAEGPSRACLSCTPLACVLTHDLVKASLKVSLWIVETAKVVRKDCHHNHRQPHPQWYYARCARIHWIGTPN